MHQAASSIALKKEKAPFLVRALKTRKAIHLGTGVGEAKEEKAPAVALQGLRRSSKKGGLWFHCGGFQDWGGKGGKKSRGLAGHLGGCGRLAGPRDMST